MYGAAPPPRQPAVRAGPIPIALPVPPSLPPSLLVPPPSASDGGQRPRRTGRLDAHVRWSVEDGGIVRAGERIGTLRYAPAGASAVPPPLSSGGGAPASAGGTIRPRVKKRRWAGGGGEDAPRRASDAAGGTEGGGTDGGGPGCGDDAVTVELRAPSNGFLRLIYKRARYGNAVAYECGADGGGGASMTAINLILAAVEPCEHPAVVGGLCAVCGADMRAPPSSAPNGIAAGSAAGSGAVRRGDVPGGAARRVPPQQRRQQPPLAQIPRRAQPQPPAAKKAPPADPRRQRILDQQRRIASSIAEEKKRDEEMAEFDLEGAVASHKGRKGPLDNDNGNGGAGAAAAAGLKRPAPSEPPPAKPPAGGGGGGRSLSSLLSGARATSAMRRPAGQTGGPPPPAAAAGRRPDRHPAARRSRPAGSATSAPSASDGMSKVTVSGGVTIDISESEAKSIADGQERRLREERRLCLVLDLDHTLLHATDDYRACRFVAREVCDGSGEDGGEGKEGGDAGKSSGDDAGADDGKPPPAGRIPNPDRRPDVRPILLPVELPPDQAGQYLQTRLAQRRRLPPGRLPVGMPVLPRQPPPPPVGSRRAGPPPVVMRHYVKLRPHLREFLERIGPMYQLSVYTAGTRAYAEAVALMVCRHAVGAEMDEESLNDLRAEAAGAEEEARRRGEERGRRVTAADWMDEDGEAGAGPTTGGEDPAAGDGDGGARNGAAGGPGGRPDDGDPADAEPGGGGDRWRSVKIDGATGSVRKRAGDGDASGAAVPRKVRRADGRARDGGGSSRPHADDGREEDGPAARRDELRRRLDEAERLEARAVELRRKMFGSRIVSRTDVGDLGKDVKSLRRVFPCGGNLAAILDDREDVWANAKNNTTGRPGEPPENLFLVKPYHWRPFRGYADVNNASGQDLSGDDGTGGGDDPHADGDEQLLWTADVLRRLHARFYSPSPGSDAGRRTVPDLLRSMRREVLGGHPRACLVFSGVVPLNQQNVSLRVRPHLVRYAEELGGTVLPSVGPDVTHVVAKKDGSEKCKRARRDVPGCHIVHTSWLMECYWSVTRRDTGPHRMGPGPAVPHRSAASRGPVPPAGDGRGPAPLLLGDDVEESDEDGMSDDDFAAELEMELAH